MGEARGAAGTVTIPPQNIYEDSETQKLPLGTRLVLGERIFHYARAGAPALTPGTLAQCPVPAADHTALAIATVAAGQTEVTLTNGASTALTANMYRDGFLWCDGGTNVGHGYRIKSHPAALVNATCVFTLYDELVEALTNATETAALHRNPYDGLIIHPSPPTAHVVGVPPVDVTAAYYFWLQTWGPAPVVTEGTLVIGNHAAIGDGTDGGVQPADTDVELIVGDVMRVEAEGEYSLIYLRLAP